LGPTDGEDAILLLLLLLLPDTIKEADV